MGAVGRVLAGVLAGLFIVVGGYVWADVHDFVPGSLTIAPPPAPAAPFPTVPVPAVAPELAVQLPDIDPSSATPSSEYIARLAQDFAKNTDILGERVGVMVSDSLTGEVLAQVNQNLPMVPASVQKLMTGAAAVEVLDTERTLKTKVLQGRDAQIFLVGEGDMLLAPEAGNPEALNGRAGLLDLATQTADNLKAQGTTKVELFLDDSIFTGTSIGPWPIDMVLEGYAAPVSAVAVDVGREKAGMYAPRFQDPGLEATKHLASLLEGQGITVTGPARKNFGEVGEGVTITGDAVLAQVESAPLAEIIDYAMKVSDNTLTEILGFTVARQLGKEASFSGATSAVLQTLQELGIDTTGVTLADCSGLGDNSNVTPRVINDLLNLMVSADHPAMREAAIGLSIAGLDGTLGERFTDRNGRGLVRGKTGSLNNVTSLAGTVVTLDDRLLTFVLFADETPGGQYGPRTAMDDFVEQLAECGCQE